MVPWEHEACRRLPSPGSRRATGCGSTSSRPGSTTRTPPSCCSRTGRSRSARPAGPGSLGAVEYAASRFAALPNTSVYIDAGAADWPKDNPAEAAEILVRAGVDQARGFALNSTHYAPGRQHRLRHQGGRRAGRRGSAGKHFVVNTSSNGQGFDSGRAREASGQREGLPDADRARLRDPRRPADRRRGEPAVGADAENAAAAAEAHVDAYLWFGRPWLTCRTTPSCWTGRWPWPVRRPGSRADPVAGTPIHRFR